MSTETKAPKAKRVNVSGTVTPELNAFLEEHRWTNRLSKSDVINEALVEWGNAHGFDQAKAEADAQAEATKAEAEAAKPSAPKGK